MSQVSILNITSLSANLNCEPPLAVFHDLKLHSQTRSNKLVELLHRYALGVSYKKVLTTEVTFPQAVADQTRNNVFI